MGVKGLWRLLAPVGKPISLESLDGKILGVDVSIWLNKAAKGMRDKHGNSIYNAHLVLIFHRICKLLFYGVKPVFVFDGGVPELKKKTLKARRECRVIAETKRSKTKEKILRNYLQTKALEAVTGTKSSFKLNLKEKKEADIFDLPSQPASTVPSQSDSSSEDDLMNEEEEWLKTLNETHIQAMFDKPDLVDIDSEEFNTLPSEVKHELLTEIKDSHRRRYRQQDQKVVELPKEANNFSNFQLKNLMKRGRITHQIDQLRKDMNSSMTAQFIQLHSEDFEKAKIKHNHVESKQYASNEKQRYILIKNVKKSKDENVLFNTSLDADYQRFKQREQRIEEEIGKYQRLERPAAKFQLIMNENAKRKRFGSDSSDEVLEKYKRQCIERTTVANSGQTDQLLKDDVEYMSSDSSSTYESSEEEITDHNQTAIYRTKNMETLPIISSGSVDAHEDPLQWLSKDNKIGEISKGENLVVEIQEISVNSKPVIINSEPEMVDQKIYSSIETSNKINLLHDGSLIDQIAAGNSSKNEQQSTTYATDKDSFAPEGNKNDVMFQDSLLSPCSSTSISFLSPNQEAPLNNRGRQVESASTQATTGKSKEELLAWQERLTREQYNLQRDTQKQSRQAATLTTEMYQDVQTLLQLFGIPYLVSPAEAEAQCAQLDYSKLTDGSVTDDSDVFLFGARKVYKNIFNQKKYAECYLSTEIEKMLYLTREKLIALAFLTGSDYTEGVQGIGSITAMEVLHEFSRKKAKETLKIFKEWIKLESHEQLKPGSNLKSKLKDVDLPRSFNSSSVWEAYLSPAVDTSDEPFEWGDPDLMAIKEFASEKFGWLHSRTNEMLQPVLERLQIRKEKQKTLKEYFKPTSNINKDEIVGSKRLLKILQKMSSGVSNQSPENEGAKNELSNITHIGGDSFFKDTSIETDLLDIDMKSESMSNPIKSSTSKRYKQQTVSSVYKDNAIVGPSTQTPHNKFSSKNPGTVSSNNKVQTKKVENLIKAAAESLKPSSPFIKMQHVNNIIRNKMFQQRRKVNDKGRKQKQKIAMTLLEQAESMTSSSELKPLKSSESDSE